MELIYDHEGRAIRLINERLRHILGHPEMKQMGQKIKEMLSNPEKVVQSVSDSEAYLYYRFYTNTLVGNKYLCVVVKFKQNDTFVLTAYLTDTIKKGDLIWPKR